MPDATTTLTPAERGLTRLDLDGAFTHPHWLAFLCGGLASAGVSVVSGHTVRQSPLRWTGHLLLDSSRARTPLELLDLLALAGTRPAVRDAAAPRLTAFDVQRQPDRQLAVTITADDDLGFLGRFLGRVSLLTLLPSELEIQTVGTVIQDRIVFGGIGRTPPSDELLASLRELLAGLVAAGAFVR